MLYAIVSDIHANRQAWEAVLGDIRAYQADEILCLGDIVGYGPAPAEVLRSVYAHCRHIIIGNHDAALCGRTDSSSFNPRAQTALAWTRKHVDSKANDVLRSLSLSLKGENFRCVHGSPNAPSQYNYILEEKDAEAAWEAFTEQICFVGHSHVPGIFFSDSKNKAQQAQICDFSLDKDNRYIVNVGSVGQPRDGSVLASYCLFNSDTRTVYFRRVAFDVEAYERDLEQTAIPKGVNGFLNIARGIQLPPVRELIDFSPFTEETEKATEKNVELLERKLHHWQVFALIALLVIIILAGAVTLSLQHIKGKNPGKLYPRRTSVSCIEAPGIDEELIDMPAMIGKISLTNRLQWFDIRLTDPLKQFIFIETEQGKNDSAETPLFRINSQVQRPVSIQSIAAIAPRNSRFRAKLQFKCPQARRGFLELLIIQKLPNEEIKILGRSEANIIGRKNRWYQCSSTLKDPLRGGEKIFPLIRGEFTGEIKLRKLSFARTK